VIRFGIWEPSGTPRSSDKRGQLQNWLLVSLVAALTFVGDASADGQTQLEGEGRSPFSTAFWRGHDIGRSSRLQFRLARDPYPQATLGE
jgi:hypothetical protein